MSKLDLVLNKKAFWPLLLFFIGAMIAFWPGYFSKINNQNFYTHAHGISMTLWLLMLILQPFLIKLNLRHWHRIVGKISYVLVPVILISIIRLFRYHFKSMPAGVDFYYSFSALVLISALAFTILYILAIYHRKNSIIHARYMICTLFPIVTPVTDRLISRYFSSLVSYAPMIGESPILPFFGFIISDIILLSLIFLDRKNSKGSKALIIGLVINLIFQLSVFHFYKWDLWKSITHFILS